MKILRTPKPSTAPRILFAHIVGGFLGAVAGVTGARLAKRFVVPFIDARWPEEPQDVPAMRQRSTTTPAGAGLGYGTSS